MLSLDVQRAEPIATLSNDLVKNGVNIVCNENMTEVYGWFANF